MLKQTIGFSLKNRMFVVVASLLIAFIGAYISRQMPIDVLPDLNQPTVVIMTEAHGMVPEKIEQLVTLPLEQVLNGATGVEQVRSSSGMGMSVIKVQFGWGTDVYRNRQIVQEKLQLAKAKLPDGVEPQMAPISSIMGQIQLVGLSSKTGKLSPEELRALADFRLKYDLLAIPGVSKVIATGGAPRQLQVIINADKLRVHQVTVQEVAEAVEKSNLNAEGGFLNIGSKAPVITVTGLLESKEELAKAVVRPDPVRPITIADIAEIDFGPALIKSGEAGIDGKQSVILVVLKQPGFDTVELTKKIEAALAEIQKGLDPDIEVRTDLFKQADFIDRALTNVFDAVRDGSIMVIIILFLFLMNWRTAFITLTAIPLSVAITAIIFAIFGLSINTMTLGGLAVAIGALVDDAIVGVENCFRRLRQNELHEKAKQKPPLHVIFEATCEVRNPIMIGTAIVVIVYVPLFFLTGMEGRLFAPIAIAYIVSVLASLVVSLTVTVALCSYLLPNHLGKEHGKDTFVVRHLKRIAGRVIRFSLNHAVAVMIGLVVLVVIGLFLISRTGSKFLPEFNEGVAQINAVLPPETGLDASETVGRKIEDILIGIEGVKSVARRTGRAEGDEHAHGVNFSEIIIVFDEATPRTREEIIEEVRTTLAAEMPGVSTAVDQPLQHLISSMLSGVKAQVAIKIHGPDIDELRRVAHKVEAAIAPIDGVQDLMVEQQVMIPNINVVPRRDQLALHGLTVEDVAETVELSMANEQISDMIDGRYSYPIVVQLREQDRRSLEDIRNLYVRKDEGELIRLKDVARVEMAMTINNIKHENVGRRIVVKHNISGRSLGEIVADIDKALDPIREDLAKTPGYTIKISGQYEAQQKASKRIVILSIMAVMGMVFILYLHFRSINLSLQVLVQIPQAFTGAVAVILLTGQTMSIATLVGFISLGGIASRNAILLIDHYLHLALKEGEEFNIDMMVKAGQERMVPMIMTALTSGIALVPLALSPNQPGKEILYPVATVIIGGLFSSTLLDFLATPATFWLFGRKLVRNMIETSDMHKAEEQTLEIEKELDKKTIEF